MTTLMPKEIEALHEALDDEYKSFATYEQVIADLVTCAPLSIFVMLRDDILQR